MTKVLIPTKLDKAAAQLLIDKNYNVVQDAATPLADLCKANADAEVLIVRSEGVTQEIIDLLPNLKLVVRAGAGFNTIDTKYARSKNIDVMNTPGANSNGVAEEVVAIMLALYRKVVPADISTRKGDWEKSKFMGREITGKTVGILGLGHIGQLLVNVSPVSISKLLLLIPSFLKKKPLLSASNSAPLKKFSPRQISFLSIFPKITKPAAWSIKNSLT